ncbi:MAG: AmmeMemoRadiSam system radical SAM enzyme [Butyrivibrio sp.]|nr:AmmeMemoRadiSam system radical SAM enzyme [Butyrivibrio sp.]
MDSVQVCEVCFASCRLSEGQTGRCHARKNVNGRIIPVNYGKITSLALDPIEKKPLRRFFPGSRILSVGSYGCNLKCPFCQNCEISCAEEKDGQLIFHGSAEEVISYRKITPSALCHLALDYRQQGNIGVAYTYNEPLVGYEFVRDTAQLVHENGMQNVIVTNATAKLPVLRELLPWTDAMNIDLKGIRPEYYERVLGGDLYMAEAFIKEAALNCHVELTTLIIPGMNDSDEEMDALALWISQLDHGDEIPLHVSRFFPRYRMMDSQPTEVSKIHHLSEIARRHLKYVYTGNC